MFKRMPQVKRKAEILDKAFSKARTVKKTINPKDRVNSIREFEINKINTVSNIITTTLGEVLEKTPHVETLDPFYVSLADLVVDTGKFKKSLAALKWAIEMTRDLERTYKRRIRGSELGKVAAIRKEYYGRVSSVLKQIEKDLIFLEDSRKILLKLPVFKNLPTIVLAGYPNVGKSSLLKSLTGADVRIASFPFTTKKIMLGYIDDKIQIIDTPGLLDRPDREKNKIEMQTMLALRHRANLILFILDPTESCGFKLTKQLALLGEIKKSFPDAPLMVCMAKSDLYKQNKIEQKPLSADKTIFISSADEDNIMDLRKTLIKSIDWKTFEFRI